MRGLHFKDILTEPKWEKKKNIWEKKIPLEIKQGSLVNNNIENQEGVFPF